MAKSSKRTLSCLSCGLREGVVTPKMEAYGKGREGILVIGEAPGQAEDRKGMPWQGRTGRLLQKTLYDGMGIDLFEDCLCVNAINCRPPDNRKPRAFEIDCCREVVVDNVLKEFRPHVILLLGSSALESFLSPRWLTDLGGIMKWRGFVITDQDYEAFVVPTFHPSYVSRMDSREVNTIWRQDLDHIPRLLESEVPDYFEPTIHYLEDLSPLRGLDKADEIAIDYETTGLKPQRQGQRIKCAAVCANDREVYAFMMPPTKAGRKPFTDLLINPNVGKMAHNMKFEHAWTYEKLGIEIQNWQWDSMLAAHQIDNRTGITSLKFQTYVNFGVIIKDEDVSKYLYQKSGSGNGFNNVEELLEQPEGQEKLLRHVALDAYYEYRLAKVQMRELDYNYLPF